MQQAQVPVSGQHPERGGRIFRRVEPVADRPDRLVRRGLAGQCGGNVTGHRQSPLISDNSWGRHRALTTVRRTNMDSQVGRVTAEQLSEVERALTAFLGSAR